MFVIYNDKTKLPIKVWLKDETEIDDSAITQAYNLSNLPFIYKWVSLMPDTHAGIGMPIGGVIACENVIIPNAVGVDIGCGMAFCGTNIKLEEIKNIKTGSGTLIQAIIGDILRNIPVGFNHYKKPQECLTLDKTNEEFEKYNKDTPLIDEIKSGYYQCGTLGGGNHFIELQEDDNGFLCIMIHSGSRHFGNKICQYFNSIAKELNQKYYVSVPKEYNLAFLPLESEFGKRYLNWMNLALDFAFENRNSMLERVKQTVLKYVKKYADIDTEFDATINCHHNYASLEHHYGKNVWVHRKGATRAKEGELGIIPGAMGSYSYIVEGLGNPESFCTSSHGAGRKYSRTEAIKTFSVESVINDLKDLDVVLGKNNKKDVAEESRFAYKDINEVMDNQKDLVKPIRRLKTVGVVKG